MLNLELYDKYEKKDFSPSVHHSIEVFNKGRQSFKFDILPGEQKMIVNQKIKQEKQLSEKKEDYLLASLKAYLDRICTLSTSRFRKQQLEAKYTSTICDSHGGGGSTSAITSIDEYMKENVAIINLVE